MKLFLTVIAATVVISQVTAAKVATTSNQSGGLTTAQRISRYNYPVETHQALTSDGYVLTMFRIPYSPKLNNRDGKKPVVFLMHGLLSSSDCWILNGPDNALAYLFADAGYDVWMGNARGNTYSKKNVKISYLQPSFWNFSWDEIALKDLPAMIDYALFRTRQNSLHYIGHSQGTTTYFVLMSEIPRYNNKIKTAHMLAPVAYMKNMESPLAKVGGQLLGNPSRLSDLIGSNEFMPSKQFLGMLGSKACSDASNFQPMCANPLFLVAGWDSKYLNYTLLPEVMETYPAGSSTGQLIHYLQEYVSGFFRKYDQGEKGNKKQYGQTTPPDYLEKKITSPVRLYYGDNDYLASVVDVLNLQQKLPNVVESFNVPIPEWNHLDFLWALNVKSVLYDRIIAAANHYEKTGQQRI